FPFRIFRIFFPRFFPFSYFISFPEVYLIRRDAYSDLYYILLSCGYFSGDMLYILILNKIWENLDWLKATFLTMELMAKTNL
ncbi:hypothetical protein, partial [Coprobacter sp.]